MFVEDLTIFFNTAEFAESATYNGRAITVIETEATERLTGLPGFAIATHALLIRASEVERPKAGDTVIFRGSQFSVGPYPVSESGVWRIDLLKETVQA